MKRSFLILLVAALVAGGASAEELKLSPRHVTVTGTAIARAQPDTIMWHIVVRRQNKDLPQAQAECDLGLKKVLALRDEFKLKPEDVQTSNLSIQKIFDRDQAGNQTSFRHFQVERSITLRQRDTTRFDQTLAGLVGTGDLETSYSLATSKYHELRKSTRLEAVKAAREKSAAMTELLGGKLGRVLRIAEPVESWGSLGVANNFAYSPQRQVEPDQAPGTFAPGEIEIKVSIDVAFEIE